MRRRPDKSDWVYYLLPAAGDGSGRGGESYGSFAEAARALAAQEASGAVRGAGGALQIDLACALPGTAVARGKRPQHQFFVNARAAGRGGDGSEEAPWQGMAAAADELVRLDQAGELRLAPGRRLRLLHREMFAASSLESRKEWTERAAEVVFLAMTLSLVLPLVVIVGYLTYQAWPVLTPRFLFENPQDKMTAGGIWAPLVGTFYLVFFSLLLVAPVGILAGIYLNEYARDNWFTRMVNLAVMNLAGVPSIVHALHGFGAFVLFAHMGVSVLAASCTLAVMSLPVIITATREALGAVPMSFREACWNMGATRWQTIRTVVLPNSISGMLTGVIFEVSRAAGETAPILFTGVVFFTQVPDHGWESFFPYGLGDPCMALSYHLFTVTTSVRDVPPAVEYGTALVLIAVVLMVNSVSIGLRGYFRSRKKW